MRLIDGDKLQELSIRANRCDKEHANEHFINGIETVLEYAEQLPTVDAEVVVRCKDCKHYGMGVCLKFTRTATYTQWHGRSASRRTSVPTVNERTEPMQKGDIVRARFLTMPEPFPGAGATKDNLYHVRKATVVYVPPKGRYIVAECKGVRETFSRRRC